MGILLKNGTFIQWDTLEFTRTDIFAEEGVDGAIRFLDANAEPVNEEEHHVLDCTGKLVTKSFGSGHHHVYSALARGMPPPPKKPENFREILQYIWWTLDKNLDEESIRYSALATAISAAKAGTTFVTDHHASPECIEGSLDIIAEAFDEVGVNHLLCYEATDRGGPEKALKGLRETERYLKQRQGLVGLHASFTVGPETLEGAADLMQRFDSGIHMHLAEGIYDQEHCLENYGKRVTKRLDEAGILESPKTILVHGLHLDEHERQVLQNKPCRITENMESNLKNKVGSFSGEGLRDNIMLGTDGMHSDMIRSARAAFFTGQISDNIDFMTAYKRFRNIHRYLAENSFSGDGDNNLVVIDYDGPTDINTDNFPGHFVFGLSSAHVKDVIANGKLLVKDRQLQTIDEDQVLHESRIQARRLWKKMGRL